MENTNLNELESNETVESATLVNDKNAIKNSMSPEEYELFELEKMRYTTNKIPYNLGMLGVVFSVCAMFIALNSLDPNMNGHGWLTVVKILMNIVILLFGFLSCEKVKVYDEKYSYLMSGFGALCVLRIFWYPLNCIRYWAGFMSDINAAGGGKTAYDAVKNNYVSKLGETMIGKWNETTNSIDTTGYLTANGYVRGIILIILLGLAAACFFGSSVIGIRNSKKLHNYLNSLEK